MSTGDQPVATGQTPSRQPEVPPGEQLVLTLDASLLAPRQARHAVAAWMGELGFGEALIADVVLIVSELVTNAVVHARSLSRFAARVTPSRRVRVEVGDDDPAPPEPSLHREVGGAGLHLVARLSAAWGWAPHEGGGKVVWAETGPRSTR